MVNFLPPKNIKIEFFRHFFMNFDAFFNDFFILLNFGWMVNLVMGIFEFLTKFQVFWHPCHPWVCVHSDLKQIWAIPPTV